MADTERNFASSTSLQSALSNVASSENLLRYTLASVPRSVGRTAKTFGKERGKYKRALGLDRSRAGEGLIRDRFAYRLYLFGILVSWHDHRSPLTKFC